MVYAYIGMGCVYRQYMAEAITPPSFRRKEDFVMNNMKQKQNEIVVAFINAGVRKVWLVSILFTTFTVFQLAFRAREANIHGR